MDLLIEAKETEKYLSSTIEVLREIEIVKQELAKLKLSKDCVLEEKTQAEKKAEALSLKNSAHLSLVEALKNEIEQINEEKAFLELGTLECLRELKAIQAERRHEAKEYSAKMDEIFKKADYMKELEVNLEATNLDVNKIQSEIELARAKEELVSIKEQGFKFMESMDLVRTELKNVKEKIFPLKKAEDRANLALEKINSKLLRANVKLEEISEAEKRVTSLVTNTSLALQQLKVQSLKSTEEAKLDIEECSKIKDLVLKMEYERELNQKRLDTALRELEEVKLSESKAVNYLNSMNEKTLRSRVNNFHNNSRITISNVEYEYLKEREAKASEIAEKKVAAAQNLIEALKASEREALMKAEIVEREIGACSRVEEEEEIENTAKREKTVKVAASPRRTMNRGVNIRTPTRRSGKFVKGSSPSNQNIYRSPSFVVKKRREVMPSLAKFFSKKNIERGL